MSYKIVRIVQDFPSAAKIYGHFVSTFHISVQQKRLGHEVLVICPGKRNETEYVSGIKVLRVKVKRPLSSISFQLAANKIIQEYFSGEASEVIHSHGRTGLLLSYSKHRPPHVVHLHGLPYAAFEDLRKLNPTTLKGLCYDLGVHRLFKIALKKAEAVISYSKDVASMLSAYDVPTEKIFVVHNGVDDIFLARSSRRTKALQTLGVDIYEEVIIFVGRLKWVKGIYHLLRAMPKIVRQHPSAKLLIVGGGDRAAVETVRRIAVALKIEKQIRLIGHVPHNLMPQYYSRAQVHVATTIAPGYPKTVLESLACGTPVVASRNTENKEILLDNRCGCLVDPTSPTEIASEVNYLLSSSDVREEMGLNGYELIKRKFTWRNAVENIIDIYNQLAANDKLLN